MENKKDNILRNKLSELEIAPPSEVWANISEAFEPKKKTIPLFWKVAAGVVFAVGILTTYFIKNKSNISQENTIITETQQRITHEKITTRKKSNTTNEEINKTTLRDVSNTQQEKAKIEALQSEKSSVNPEQKIAEVKNTMPNVPDTISNTITIAKAYPIIPDEITNYEDISANEKIVDLSDSESNNEENENRKAQTLDLLLAENTPDKEEESKWSLGGSFSPFAGGNSSGSDGSSSQVNAQNTGSINQDELLAYAGGLDVNLKLGKRFSIQSGLHYSRMGRKINDLYRSVSYSESMSNSMHTNEFYSDKTGILNAQTISDAQNYFELTDAPVEETRYVVSNVGSEEIDGYIKQNFEYFEIPFILKYKLIDKQIDFNLLGGLNTNVLLGNKSYIKNDASKMEMQSRETPDPVSYNSTFGFGLEYGIMKNLNLNLEPVIKYYLTPEKNPAYLADRTYIFGIYTGIFYNF